MLFQIDEIRKRQQQQVLPKPNLDLVEKQESENKSEIKKSSSVSSIQVNPVKKPEKQPVSSGQLKDPVLQGGEDSTVKDKRDTVKAVRTLNRDYL